MEASAASAVSESGSHRQPKHRQLELQIEGEHTDVLGLNGLVEIDVGRYMESERSPFRLWHLGARIGAPTLALALLSTLLVIGRHDVISTAVRWTAGRSRYLSVVSQV
jgi:hypothetical protein